MTPFHSLSFTGNEKRIVRAMARVEKAEARLGKKQGKGRRAKAAYHRVR